MINFTVLLNILSAGILSVLCSCAVGNIHNNSNLENITSADQAKAEIRIGMTMEEVRSKWGKPSQTHTSNNTIHWGYSHRRAVVTGLPGLSKVKEKVVNVVFDNGRVSNVLFVENSNF